MCGVAGYFGPFQPAALDGVSRMLDDMLRRGPDSGGIHTSEWAILGHRRLAVLDRTPAGRQPMTLEDGTAITFNGAIYNFRELRRELERDGHHFRSSSDTEVLLRGYRSWGINDLVPRLRGMFAFAIWDEPARRGFLVRDRLGVKPLCFSVVGQSLMFASTAEALRLAGASGEMDMSAVADFLAHGYIAEEHSLFRGIRKLAPATIAEWSPEHGLRSRTYWQIPTPNETLDVGFAEATERVEQLLLDATRVRLHADVPVGALLSGGVDSALVSWAALAGGASLRTFTVSVPGDRTDESEDAQLTARELGLELTVLPIERPNADVIGELNTAFGEPFAIESALGMLRIARAVDDTGTRVLLTGDGGDDVFLGYPRHRHLLAAQRLRGLIPRFGRRLLERTEHWVPGPSIVRRPKRLLDYAVGGLPAFLNAGFGLRDYHSRQLLGERFDESTPFLTRAMQVPNSDAILEGYLKLDYRSQFVSEYLQKVDGSTMHYGIEARAPFLDQEVWTYGARLPFDIRLNRGVLKAVLRDIARRRISNRVAFGRKRGFRLPVQRWVISEWLPFVRDNLADGVLVREGIVRQDAVSRLLSEPGESDGHVIWNLIVLETWLAQRGL